VGLEEPLTDNPVGLPPEHPTLPSLLRARGYSTWLVGKWHLGQLPHFGPLLSGYDHFYGFRRGAVDYYSHGAGGDDDLWDDDVLVHQAGYMTDLLGARAVDVIDRSVAMRRPFFISLHFNAPHWPWEGPGDEAESRRVGTKDLHDFDGGTQRTYRRMVEAMDVQVGRVVEALERHGVRDNTIIVFTSDNGGERFSDTWPFTGRKQELLEGGLRIPAIISWPGHLPGGIAHQQVMITMDWFPTLLAAAGGAPDANYPPDGINLLPLITGTTGESVPRTLYWRYKGNAQRAIRDGDMKYLKLRENTFLFNVAEDPMERANLKERQPEVFAHLLTKWLQWNETMLQELEESATSGNEGANWADHVGSPPPTRSPDNPGKQPIK
jgi:arylsulfatase A-like enzyme